MSDVEGKEDNSALEIEAKFENMREILGRKSNVNQIVNDLKTLKPNKPFVVMGSPGIGKTEICRCVYKALKEEIPDLYMPFIDCMSISDINALTDAIIRALGFRVPEGTTFDGMLNFIKNHLAKMNVNRSKVVIYFDNWESIWYGVKSSESEMDLLINILQLIKACGCYSLISTTSCLKGIDIKDYDIPILDFPFDREIFLSIYTTNDEQLDEETFGKLLEELAGYPLAIVLVAYQAKRYPNLKMVLDNWRAAYANTGISKHRSMEAAVRMSWNAIKHLESAKVIWGIMSIAVGDISIDLLKEVMEQEHNESWWEGLEELKSANVITYKGQYISMLSPLKELCFKFYYDDSIEFRNFCLSLMVVALLRRAINCRNDELDHITSLHAFIEVFDEILNVTDKLMLLDSEWNKHLLNSLVVLTSGYYLRSHKSIHVVEKLCQYYKDSPEMLGGVLMIRGDLQLIYGDVEKAESSYSEAEVLSINKKANISLAHVLYGRGNVQNILGKFEKAESSYSKAEELHKEERNNEGLARALVSRGNLQRNLGEFEKAESSYLEAEVLYRSEKQFIGLANLLVGRGNLQRCLGEFEKAKSSYLEAEALYRDEKVNLGLANVLKIRGDLHSSLGEMENAMSSYLEAEALFRIEKRNLNSASVNFSMAMLLFGNQEGTEKALELLKNTKIIFESEQMDTEVACIQKLIDYIHEAMESISEEAE